MSCIYILINTCNGKKYIGQTTQKINQRLQQHQWASGGTPCIHRAIKKYGWSNFIVEVYECSHELLNEREMQLIEQYNTTVPYGYNLQTGGKTVYAHSSETKKKMSLTKKGGPPTYIPTSETRSKMSLSAKRYAASLTEKKRKDHYTRSTPDPEVRKQATIKMIATMSCKLQDELDRMKAKRSVSLKAAYQRKTEEQKLLRAQKISMAKKGKRFTEEHRKKLSEAARIRWVNYHLKIERKDDLC